MVSPPDKNGGEVLVNPMLTRAARTESPSLPMALMFASLSAFAEPLGTGVATEYLAERTGEAGTQGWRTHAITPAQDPLTVNDIATSGSPLYVGDASPDLTTGVFRAFSPLTAEPNVEKLLTNLYTRSDLRSPGPGTYQLDTPAYAPLGALTRSYGSTPKAVGASTDLSRLLVETRYRYTADASATFAEPKLFLSEGGAVRYVGYVPPIASASCTGPACEVSPRAIAGQGAGTASAANIPAWTPHVLSADGTRAFFTVGAKNSNTNGRLYMRDDEGTAATADDTTYRLDYPDPGAPPLSLNATTASGSKNLTALSTAQATGTLTTGSDVITGLTGVAGSFLVGQAISAPGIPASTTITAVDSPTQLEISAPATETGPQALAAGSAPLEVGWLVSGPGIQPGTTITRLTSPTQVELSLAAQASASAVALTASAPATYWDAATDGTRAFFTSAQALTPDAPVGSDQKLYRWSLADEGGGRHLAYVSVDDFADEIGNSSVAGTLGVSADGSYVYYLQGGQSVAGEPQLNTTLGIYEWHEGAVHYVGQFASGPDLQDDIGGASHSYTLRVELGTRVTPDGTRLLISLRAPPWPGGFDQGHCSDGSPCPELYLYDAATGAHPLCVSCSPAGRAPATPTVFTFSINTGASAPTTHLNQPLTEDGSRVFFTTAEPLVPQDTNGARDVYEWEAVGTGDCAAAEADGGCLRLISSGIGSSDSYFLEASADGSDVFFTTHDALVGWDTDGIGNDIYDARVDGGLQGPGISPAPCEGEACQPSSQAAPATSAIQTTADTGSGNAKVSRPRCPKAKQKPRAGARAKARHRLAKPGRCRKPAKHRRHKAHPKRHRHHGHKPSKHRNTRQPGRSAGNDRRAH
jgi:hypothetical protein